MNDQDIIRKAVELADGFVPRKEGEGFVHYYGPSEYEFIGTHFGEGSDQFLYDALAAQLVRQVDEAGGEVWGHKKTHYMVFNDEGKVAADITGPDRSMNTIRAIVESGVLE